MFAHWISKVSWWFTSPLFEEWIPPSWWHMLCELCGRFDWLNPKFCCLYTFFDGEIGWNQFLWHPHWVRYADIWGWQMSLVMLGSIPIMAARFQQFTRVVHGRGSKVQNMSEWPKTSDYEGKFWSNYDPIHTRNHSVTLKTESAWFCEDWNLKLLESSPSPSLSPRSTEVAANAIQMLVLLGASKNEILGRRLVALAVVQCINSCMV